MTFTVPIFESFQGHLHLSSRIIRIRSVSGSSWIPSDETKMSPSKRVIGSTSSSAFVPRGDQRLRELSARPPQRVPTTTLFFRRFQMRRRYPEGAAVEHSIYFCGCPIVKKSTAGPRGKPHWGGVGLLRALRALF